MKMDDRTREKFKSYVRINPKLLLMKAHYFCYYGALAGVIPPLVSIFTQLGASPTLVGILFAVLPFIQCTIKPISGALIDTFQIPKTMFLICTVILTVAFYSINFIPEPDPGPASGSPNYTSVWMAENWTTLVCDPTSSNLMLTTCEYPLPNITLTSCQASCTFPAEGAHLSRLLCPATLQNCLEYNQYLQVFTDGVETKTRQANLTLSLSPQDYLTLSLNPRANLTLAPGLSKTGPNHSESVLLCHQFQIQSLFANHTLDNGSTACPNDTELVSPIPCAVHCLGATASGSKGTLPILEPTNYRFVWIWAACIVIWSTSGTILSTSDANLLNVLGGQRDSYGQTRLFGSAGWGLMSAVSAHLIDLASAERPTKDYSPGFHVFLTLMVCDILVVAAMSVAITERPKALGKDVVGLFHQTQFSLFALGIFCVGMVTGVTWVFLIVFLNELHGSQLVLGIYYAMECFASEIPFFLISGWIVDKLGHHFAMSFVLVISGLKTLCFFFVHNVWYILFIAMLHGPNYGIFYATSATYASVVAPPGASVTLQSVFQALFEGAGVGFGNLVGGLIYETVGARQTFLIFGSVCLTLGLLHFWCTWALRKRHQYPVIR